MLENQYWFCDLCLLSGVNLWIRGIFPATPVLLNLRLSGKLYLYDYCHKPPEIIHGMILFAEDQIKVTEITCSIPSLFLCKAF
jgi:hypothetical protein